MSETLTGTFYPGSRGPDWYDRGVVKCLDEVYRRYGEEIAARALRAYEAARPSPETGV